MLLPHYAQRPLGASCYALLLIGARRSLDERPAHEPQQLQERRVLLVRRAVLVPRCDRVEDVELVHAHELIA